MKKFVKYIFSLVLVVIVLMLLLDYSYTTMYKNGAPRSKVMWMNNLKNESLDFVIFGSSRANHFVDPNMILDKTRQNGINLAIPGSGPIEIKLAVQKFLQKNTSKRIFIQVDYNFNQEPPGKIGQLSWIPFIVDSEVYNVFKPYGREYYLYKNVPFYRYLTFESRLGFRTVILSCFKGIDYSTSRGYREVYGTIISDKLFSFSLKDNPNPHYEEINKICKEHNIEVFYFTSPIYKPNGSFEVLEKYLPNYYNLSTSIKDKDLFKDHTHLNEKGAVVFTDIFINLFFTD